MEPYSYVGNNPIMFTDPTGMVRNMIDGPGDEFTSLEEAAKDFGNEYNGLSISYNIEVGTNFYESKNEKGEKYISYTIPIAGGAGAVPEHNDLVAGQEIIATGHTHAGDTNISRIPYKVNGKTYVTSNANRFLQVDIDSYNNKSGNVFNRKIQGVVITPNGAILHYDPDKTYLNIDVKGIFGKTPSYNKPIDMTMPWDPASDVLRLNEKKTDTMPKILPIGFDFNFNEKRNGY